MKSILLILALGFSLYGNAQYNIGGTVGDKSQKMPSVTVMLLNQDTLMISGVASDSKGEFLFQNIPPGHYVLKLSMIGYSDHIQSVHIDNRNVVLDGIIMEESAVSLDELVVHEEKLLFEGHSDRVTINMSGSITSSGSSVLDVLQKSPGVLVNRQGGGISINGKTGVRLIINKQIIMLPPDAVLQLLDGMQASNIEKIELVSTPSSAIDAEGNGGLIHLVTKTQDEVGTMATVGLVAGMKGAENIAGNASLQHRKDKFAVGLDYAISRDHNRSKFELTHSYDANGGNNLVSIYSDRDNITTQQNLTATLEWKIRKNTTMRLLLTGYRRNWNMSANGREENTLFDSAVRLRSDIRESNLWQSATGSIGLQHSITPKSKIDFSLDYLYYRNSNPSSYDHSTVDDQHNADIADVSLTKTTPIRFLVAKADYQYDVLPTLKIESGVKITTSQLKNDVFVYRTPNDAWQIDTTLSSRSSVSEKIIAGYISGQWYDPRKVWQIQAGVRYEYTVMSLNTLEQAPLLSRTYGYLFPSLTVTRKMQGDRSAHFGYTRRITRPTYNDIAPYVFFWGRNVFSAGNTGLLPAIAESVNLGYNVNGWTFAIYYTDVANEIAILQPTVSATTGDLMFRAENLKYLRTLGVSASHSVSPAKWWDVQFNLALQLQNAQTAHLLSNRRQELANANLYLVNQWKLPKDFALEISAVYQTKTLSGIARMLPTLSVNAGMQKSLGSRGIIRLSIDDILYYTNWRVKTHTPENNINSYFDYDWHNQFVRISYSRSFGSRGIKSLKAQSGAEEERKRVSN